MANPNNIWNLSQTERSICGFLYDIIHGNTGLKIKDSYTTRELFDGYRVHSPHRNGLEATNAYIVFYQNLRSICLKSSFSEHPILTKLNAGTGRGHYASFRIEPLPHNLKEGIK